MLAVVAAGLWLSLAAIGFGCLWHHSTAPGDPGRAPARWPAGAAIELASGGWTLVLLAHPRCPCTRASLGELDRLMAAAGGRLHACVLLYAPTTSAEDWPRTDLWRTAAAIPGVTVRRDPGGRLARLLGAETSGQVVVYDPRGALVFAGGITPGRGHAGDSRGRASILDLLERGRTEDPRAPVYGCPILGEESGTEPGGEDRGQP